MVEQKESFSSQKPHSYRIFLSLLELSKIGRKTWRFPVSAIRCWNWQLLLPSQDRFSNPVALKVVAFIFLDLLPAARQLPSRWQVLSAVVEVSMVISVNGGLPTTPLRVLLRHIVTTSSVLTKSDRHLRVS